MMHFPTRRYAIKTIASAILLLSVAACASSGASASLPSQQLIQAAKAGDVAGIKAAITAGADINAVDYSESKNGRRALNYAAWYNRSDAVRALVAAGAPINLTNRTGFTPLHHAAEAGSLDAARVLLELGADRTLRNNGGLTPLEVAEANHHAQVADVLR
jgi:ankyrin repeat protein